MTFSAVFDFYPRPPRGGRPERLLSHTSATTFLSTPSARRATKPLSPPRALAEISIHALREEGDLQPVVPPLLRLISIHALREEGDGGHQLKASIFQRFLSTPSARRATDCEWKVVSVKNVISIHALREEGDLLQHQHPERQEHFYPRPPRGGRPPSHQRRQDMDKISIHALREEGDASNRCCWHLRHYFYPRPPRGGRLMTMGSA